MAHITCRMSMMESDGFMVGTIEPDYASENTAHYQTGYRSMHGSTWHGNADPDPFTQDMGRLGFFYCQILDSRWPDEPCECAARCADCQRSCSHSGDVTFGCDCVDSDAPAPCADCERSYGPHYTGCDCA